jgi:hypothetical protein
MSVPNETNLGTLLTVVTGRPLKLSLVVKELSANSKDPLNQRPFGYFFVEVSRPRVLPLDVYIVWVSDMLVRAYLAHEVVRNQSAARFGLRRIRESPDIQEYLFTTTEHDDIRYLPVLHGETLERAILSFFFDFYTAWPQLGIGVPDLEENIAASKEDITQWVQTLKEKDYLSNASGTFAWPRERGFGFSSGAYKINPKKAMEIKEFLSSKDDVRSGGSPSVFLSYNSIDRVLAGELKSRLEERGMNVFLAHEDIEPAQEWIPVIEKNLKQCGVFVALITDDFRNSKWTDQESGCAIAFEHLIIPVFTGNSPHGFLGKFQGIRYSIERSVESLAQEIHETIQRRSAPKALE